MNRPVKKKLYIDIAERVISLIDRGVLKQGDKVPSIREFSQQLGISKNTIKESYWYLESKHYIEAVPQSGFYVNNLNTGIKPAVHDNGIIKENKEIEDYLVNSAKTSMCRIYGALGKHGYYSPEIELGIASLPNSLWPVGKLNKYFQEAQRHEHNEAYNYNITPGYWPLREQISLHAMKAGYILKPEEVIITNGCSEAIYLALCTICKPGDAIAVESPLYFNFLKVCEKMKLNIIEIPNSSERGINLDTLQFVINKYKISALLAIPTFNNPNGSCMTEPDKEKLVHMLEKHNIPLIEDDIYAELYYSGKRPKPCKAFDQKGNVILCSSFSKTIAPGIRLGWIAPGKYYNDIDELKLLFNIGTSTLPQIAISKYLRDGGFDRHLRNVRRIVEKNVIQMRETIIGHFPAGTEVSLPLGGFVLWVKLPEKVNSILLYEILLREKIIIAPGDHFSISGNYMNYFRINASQWNETVYNAVIRIAVAVKKML
ncbi:MAG: PLP-dependent aminotransferase family protein [Spirochaetes bacterium]|nr:PLP-dependent aminotransferase family protein [Spirochaetota bacterium]